MALGKVTPTKKGNNSQFAQIKSQNKNKYIGQIQKEKERAQNVPKAVLIEEICPISSF